MAEVPVLFTASWRSDLIPGSAALVSISRSAPRGRGGYKRYSALAPGPWFRDPMPDTDWVARYEDEVLAPLDARTVARGLMSLGEGRPVLLMCWEPPPPDQAWCHRALVSRWLWREAGISVPEYRCEQLGHGDDHPKLPSCLVRHRK